jgi:hypothetical protein
MTLRVAESDEKYKQRVFFEGAVMTLRVAEGDEKYKRRVFFDGAVMTRRGSRKAMKNTTGR